jgi:transcriptional regulator with XRE-family HTH domain/GNAT superfamily N-acetyltransferase
MTDYINDHITDHITGAMRDVGSSRGGVPLDVVLRALRRRADLSQRELAVRSGVPQTTISRVESGVASNPSFRTVERLVRAADAVLTVGAVVDGAASVPPSIPHEELRDQGGRHYPAHLDPWELTAPEKWWGAWWAASTIRANWPVDQLPAFTYDLKRAVRDDRRTRADRAASVVVRGGRHRSDGAQGGNGGVRRDSGTGVSPLRNGGATRDGGAAGTDGEWCGWVWTARSADGTLVGALWAHDYDGVVDGVRWGSSIGMDAGGTVVLDDVIVHPEWRLLGIGRRLLEALRSAVPGPVVVLASGSAGLGLIEACGFRPARDLVAPRWFRADAAECRPLISMPRG